MNNKNGNEREAGMSHDGLPLWKGFKEHVLSHNWRLEQMSPGSIDEAYDLYAAGYAARSAEDAWVKCADRLPEEPGLYLWQDFADSGDLDCKWYDPLNESAPWPKYFAWRSIKTFTEDTNNET